MIVLKKTHIVSTVCLLLALVTVILYWPVTGCGFIQFDDHQYIFENPHVIPGLTWSGFLWSFQCGYAANWHPLTWISHMIDCDLYGLNPAGHHLTNLLFHTVNTVLLFVLLYRMTGCIWRSFFVAALFGWHPLHVESVAWASERKDVLSGFFWILTLLAYANYCTRPDRSRYILAVFLFALGLMSKPMLVTLPFVLLLIDFWPLGRVRLAEFNSNTANRENRGIYSSDFSTRIASRRAARLVYEKTPFFGLAFIASALTYVAQHSGGALKSWIELPLGARCANATVSYLRYIAKAFCPMHLALIYPYPEHWSINLVAATTLLLGLVSILFALWVGRAPYLIVGWLWFLGALVPTIGLVQVGPQAMADRYLYLPGIGLSIVIVWGMNDLLCTQSWGQKLCAVLGTAALAACCICTSLQLRYWRDPEKLFRHTIEVTKGNYVAYVCLGSTMELKGDEEAALRLFEDATRIEPHYPVAQYDLGTTLVHKNRLEDAVRHFAIAVQDDPGMAEAQNNWGKALLDLGKTNQAAVHLTKAFRLKPDNAEICCNLGTLWAKQSKDAESIALLADALRLKPEYADALGNLEAVLNKHGLDEAIAHLSEAIKMKPDDPRTCFSLGLALLETNKPEEAETQFSRALQLRGDDFGVHYYLATALIRQHKSNDAISHYRKALRLQSDNADALNGLAWILASDPSPELRAGKEAMRLAKLACNLTQYRQAAFVITLAAAYAETDRYSEAIATVQKARTLALASGEADAVVRAEELQKLFESRHTVGDALNSASPKN